jgi:hypothetical protein
MADAKKKKPEEHSDSSPFMGITLGLIAIIAVVATLVYGAGKPFTPTFLNLDYIFGKMLVFITAVINFFTNYSVGIGLKIFLGLVTVFLIGFCFYLLLRILEMEEEHEDHVYHHAIDDLHGGAKPLSLVSELVADVGELADDAMGLAKRTVTGPSPQTMNKLYYGDEADMLDKDVPMRQETPQNNSSTSTSADKEGSAKWRIILKHINSYNPSDWKLAIIEADTILDGLVERSGFPGETLGERMKNADPGVFRTIKFAREAHFVRNRIAHDGSSFVLSDRDAKQTIKKYEEVFREFDYI